MGSSALPEARLLSNSGCIRADGYILGRHLVERMLRLKMVIDEGYCLKTQNHVSACNSRNHTCYRCGMYLGRCDCPELGSPLDY